MSEFKSNADIEPCLSVIMPVYNEAATIIEVVKVVLAQRPVQELVIVDDCSQDGTWDKLQLLAQNEPRIQLFRHEANQGKGAALRTGISHASAPIVIMQDADLEWRKEDRGCSAASPAAGAPGTVPAGLRRFWNTPIR